VSGLEKKESDDVLFIGFNQDQSCLAVGLSKGFKVFNCSPFHEQVRALPGVALLFERGGVAEEEPRGGLTPLVSEVEHQISSPLSLRASSSLPLHSNGPSERLTTLSAERPIADQH